MKVSGPGEFEDVFKDKPEGSEKAFARAVINALPGLEKLVMEIATYKQGSLLVLCRINLIGSRPFITGR